MTGTQNVRDKLCMKNTKYTPEKLSHLSYTAQKKQAIMLLITPNTPMSQNIPHAIIDISKTTAVERALGINQIQRSTMNGTQLRVTALFNQTNGTLAKEWEKIKKILEYT